MITTEKNQSNCKNVESNVLTDFFNLQRRARIQNLSNLTKKLPFRHHELVDSTQVANDLRLFQILCPSLD
jgi:hypothetical protein